MILRLWDESDAENLYEYAKDYERKEFTVNSSPYAVPIYHKLGFRDTDKEQTVDGLRFTPMMYKK